MACLPAGLLAQEPNFSQFIASPLSINPALAGSSDADWRAVSNIRRQWIGNISPYSTQTISIDGKLRTLEDQSYFGLGGMVLSEKAMDGLYKSNFINLNASYHQALDDNGNGISVALGVVNNSTRVDLGGLTFDQQLSSRGFNQALPITEMNLGNSTIPQKRFLQDTAPMQILEQPSMRSSALILVLYTLFRMACPSLHWGPSWEFNTVPADLRRIR